MKYECKERRITPCRDCIAWVRRKTKPELGECRRYAPRVVDKDYCGVWPETLESEGCCQGIPLAGDAF